VAADGSQQRRWKVNERVVDTSRRARVSIAEVELPDGIRFEQWVTRARPAAMVVVVNERAEVLMLRRHRFIIDAEVWELPGGYVDEADRDAAVSAAREVEEETSWRPDTLEHLLTFQPSVGSADAPQHLFVAASAHLTARSVDVNEAEEIRWIPLAEAYAMIKRGEIIGAASIIGVLEVMQRRTHFVTP
jgi:8-oxo-dGTP pyrophosphatase MutT (NUDIX family)